MDFCEKIVFMTASMLVWQYDMLYTCPRSDCFESRTKFGLASPLFLQENQNSGDEIWLFQTGKLVSGTQLSV